MSWLDVTVQPDCLIALAVEMGVALVILALVLLTRRYRHPTQPSCQTETLPAQEETEPDEPQADKIPPEAQPSVLDTATVPPPASDDRPPRVIAMEHYAQAVRAHDERVRAASS